MLVIKPLKVLVCLAIVLAMAPLGNGWGYTGPDVTAPGLQGDALSAEPTVQPRSVIRQQFPGAVQTSPVTTSRGTTYSTRSYRQGGPVVSAATISPAAPAAVCGPQGCPPGAFAPQAPAQSLVPPMFGMFSPNGLGLSGCDDAILPHVGAKQFQLSARLWYAQMTASTQLWGGNGVGLPGTELDLNRDLGLSRYQYIGEYEARCQIRCNWGIHFSFMPISYRDNSNPTVLPFWWGNTLYPTLISTLTQWERNIYSWDLVYDWYHQKHAVSSVFAGYSLYDDKLTISNVANALPVNNFTRTRSRQLGLAYAGATIERVIRNIGQATVSTECKGSVQFLEDYFGWNAQAVGRVYIPMNYGRWGYLEAGWKWMVLERNYPADIDKTNLNGVTGAIGLIF